MIILSPELAAALDANWNQPVDLYELYLDSGTVYLSSIDITWGGNHYLPYVQSRSGVKRFESGEFDRVTITFSNVDTSIAQMITQNDIEGRRLVIRKIDRTVTNDNIVIFNGLMDRAGSIGMETATIQARQLLGSIDHDAPARQFTVTCPWKFKGLECGYAGSETDCNKSWARCSQLANTARYGGFRFMPHSGTFQYKEVEQKRFLLFFKRKSERTVTQAFASADDTPYDVPIPIVLGRAQLAALPIQHEDVGSALKVLAAFSIGPVSEILYVRANEQIVTDLTVHRGELGGTGGQTPDSRFTATYPYNLLAYVGITVPSDVKTEDAAPTVTGIVLGALVDQYNTAGGFVQVGWSDNSVWNTRYFMRLALAQGGMGFPEEWIDEPVCAQTAAFCDEIVANITNDQKIYSPQNLPATIDVGTDYQRFRSTGVYGQDPAADGPYSTFAPGTDDDSSTVPVSVDVKRFTMNCAIAKAQKAIDVLYKVLLPSFRGYITWSKDGKAQIRVEKPVANSKLGGGGAAAGANQITVTSSGLFAAGDRIVIGALTAQAETKVVTGVAGPIVSLATALLNNHAANDVVHWIAMSFTDANTIGEIEYPMSDRQTSINQIVIKYVDAPAGFEQRTLEINDYAHQEKVHRINKEEIDGSAIDNYFQAWRIGQWRLAKYRDLGKFVHLRADIKASRLEIGDVVTVTTTEHGLVAVPFRVIELTYEDNDDVTILGQLYSLGIYDDTAPQTTVVVPTVFNPISAGTPINGDVERTPFEFGAIGDGVADDTTPVQQAIAAGSACKLPAGYTFLVRGVTVDSKPNFRMFGNGILKLKAAANKEVLKVTASDGAKFEDFEIDANKGAQTGAFPAFLLKDSADCRLSRLHIHDSKGDGLKVDHTTGSAANIDSCRITDNDGHGLDLVNGAGDNFITGCRLESNGGHGIYSSQGNNNRISDNPSIADNGLCGMLLENQSNLDCTSNLVTGNQQHGIRINIWTQGTASSNTINLNSRGSGSYNGFDLESCVEAQLDGNYTGDRNGTVKQDYGLHLKNCTNVRLTNNNFGVGENEIAPVLIETSTYFAYNNKGLEDLQQPTPAPGVLTGLANLVVDHTDPAEVHITGQTNLPAPINGFIGCKSWVKDTTNGSEWMDAGDQEHPYGAAGPFKFEFRIGRPDANETWEFRLVPFNADTKPALVTSGPNAAFTFTVNVLARVTSSAPPAENLASISSAAIEYDDNGRWRATGDVVFPTNRASIDTFTLRIPGPWTGSPAKPESYRPFDLDVTPPAAGNYSFKTDWFQRPSGADEIFRIDGVVRNAAGDATDSPTSTGDLTVDKIETATSGTGMLVTGPAAGLPRLTRIPESNGTFYSNDGIEKTRLKCEWTQPSNPDAKLIRIKVRNPADANDNWRQTHEEAIGDYATWGAARVQPIGAFDTFTETTDVGFFTVNQADEELGPRTASIAITAGAGGIQLGRAAATSYNANQLRVNSGKLEVKPDGIGNVEIDFANVQLASFSGSLSVAQANAVSISNLNGSLSVAQANAVSLSNLNGTLSAAQASALQITQFSGVIVTAQLAAGILDDLTKFADTMRPITRVASLPGLPNAAYPINTVVLNLGNSTLYKNLSNVWTAQTASDTITGKLVGGDILSVNAPTIIGQINAGVITHVQVSQFAGSLSTSQAAAVNVSWLNGTLSVSQAAALNINSFSGSLGTLNATTVTLVGQWGDSQIGSVSASKIIAGTVMASVQMTSPVITVTGSGFTVNINTTDGVKVTNSFNSSVVKISSGFLEVNSTTNGSLFAQVSNGYIVAAASSAKIALDASGLVFGTGLHVLNASNVGFTLSPTTLSNGGSGASINMTGSSQYVAATEVRVGLLRLTNNVAAGGGSAMGAYTLSKILYVYDASGYIGFMPILN